MLIRNQAGDKLINLDNVANIKVAHGNVVEGEQRYSIVACFTNEDWDYIGEYTTEEKATRALDMLASEYQTSMYFPRIFAIPKEFEVVV